MRIHDLKNKQVINVCDGKIIGYVSDVEFDVCKGVICALVVQSIFRLFPFCCGEVNYVIPFGKIDCIGPDTILVKVCLEEVREKRKK